MTELAEQQEKRNLLMRRIESWQAMQDAHMPVVTPLRATSPGTLSASSASSPAVAAITKAEDVCLWLPSSLPSSLLSLESLNDLRRKEARLRVAQLSDALTNICRVRRVLAAISDFNKTHVAGSGQRTTTRMQDLYARFRSKERRAASRYRAAYSAMQALDPGGTWTNTYQVLRDEDLRGPRKHDEERDATFISEGRYEISWIWLTPGANGSSHEDARPANMDEFSTSMRTEWAQSRARAERWEEEEQLLLEEMRRVIAYFKWRAEWWREQAGRRGDVSSSLARGLTAYAEKQARVFEDLATRCGARWYSYVKSIGPVPQWLAGYAKLAKPDRARRSTQSAQASTGDQSDTSEASDDMGSCESELE